MVGARIDSAILSLDEAFAFQKWHFYSKSTDTGVDTEASRLSRTLLLRMYSSIKP
jgi:hypothetical protein